MPIIQITDPTSISQEGDETTFDIVAIHGIYEDESQTWTDSASKILWLRDLLPQKLRGGRTLMHSYKAEALKSPGARSSDFILRYATSLIAELCADRQLENASQRPIVFICHGFGGLLLKRALAYSSTRRSRGVEHLRSIYTSTYGIIFMGTPHDGISKEALISESHHSHGPNHFMISLLQGSEMLNEINDQFAPLMKQFAIYNFWEDLETLTDKRRYYIVCQSSAAPAWDNVERCGIMATHSTMTKFARNTDHKFRAVYEALARYSRDAPGLIKQRWKNELTLLVREREHEAKELLQDQYHSHISGDESPADYNKWCLIPRKSSIYFTGRQKHTQDVRNMLGPIEKHVDKGRTKILVIYGLGGSGKTQFCLKYVEDSKHKYWGVFWVDASNEKNLESGFATVGTHAGLGPTMAAGIYWLSRSTKPWLLILDNADDPDLDVSAYCPSGANGHVLVTTRNPGAIEHATVGHIRFRGMEPHEATSLLLKAAYPQSKYALLPATPGKWQIAGKIAVELGYLPLALAHAGATIRRNIYTLEKYLNYYLGRRKSMLGHQRVNSVDEADIITTWEIPFQRIASRVSTEHKDAVDLMHVFAFMHFETIPERVFQRSWEALSKSKIQFGKHLEVLQAVWNEEAQARLRRAIGVLCDYSIIEYEPSKSSCSMHPVIHSWARDRLSDTDQKQWLRFAMGILAECISPSLEASGRSFRALLLPHINACIQAYESRHSPLPKTLECAGEIEKFASVYAEQGRWEVARVLQRQVIEIRTPLLGKRHKDTIRSQRALGRTLWNLFEIRPAIDVQLAVLNTLRWHRTRYADWLIWPLWKPIHVPYCLALDDLTLTLWLAGRRDLSKTTGERAVEGFKKRLGPYDPATLNAMFNLARTYLHLGEDKRCRELLVWVLRLQKRFFGMEHPDTLMTRNELGISLCASKRHLLAAQRLIENVLQARRKILGDEHAYTLWSVNDLSKLYVERGRAEEAITHLENIIPVVKRTLGENHVGMSMTRSNLGKAYFMAERFADAEEIVRPLLTQIPKDHPDWIHNMYGYTHIRFKLGFVDETEKSCVTMLQSIVQKKSLPIGDPRTVSIAELLLRVYSLQDRQNEIVALRKKIPGVGSIRNEDLFDPYGIRKASIQPSRPPESALSGAQPLSSQVSLDAEDEGPIKDEGRKRSPPPKLINRRTF